MLAKLICRVFGHPLPEQAGAFVKPIRPAAPPSNLPFIESPCPRCGTSLRMHFLPGTRGTSPPVQARAMLRGVASKNKQEYNQGRS